MTSQEQKNIEKAIAIKRQISCLEGSISENKSIIKSEDEKLSDLKKARKKLKENYTRFDNLVLGADKRILKKSYKWKGKRYDGFIRRQDYLVELDRGYYNYISDVIESINKAIAKEERKKAKHGNIIEKIIAEIKGLYYEMDNLRY